jgi:putative ABC transport system permease protein
MAGTAPVRDPGFLLALRFALREMRGGLRGFRILIACMALGVGAIAGVKSIAASITGGIAAEGQAILGGDVSVSLVQRDIPEPTLALAEKDGVVSQSRLLRAMARRADGADQALIELKAVDGTYPLYGRLEGESGDIAISQAGADGVWVDPILMTRLDLNAGDQVLIGNASYTLLGPIKNEPDRLSGGAVFGPRVLMTLEGLDRSGLIRPGSLFTNRVAVRLEDPTDSSLARFTRNLKASAEDPGWRIQSRDNAAPALSRNIERFSQFLTLVGLTALIVGGVGVGNSTRAYLDSKRRVIATFKSLGAPSRFIFRVYMIQVLILAAIGIAAGLGIGIAMPFIARAALAGILPVAAASAVHLPSLVLATAFGVLTAFVFAVWPLALAKDTQAATLFRSAGFASRRWPSAPYLAMAAAALLLLAMLAVFFSDERGIALIFLAAMAFAFVALRAVAHGIEWLAKHAPRPRSTEIRMALGNIHRPGSLTAPVVLSLGLGLALIVALTLIDGSLRNQVTGNLPKQAPSFFFLDIQSSEIEAFQKDLLQLAPDGEVEAVPMMRGRITHLKGIPAAEYKASAGNWVLSGDRGITYSATKPANATVVDGEWWAPDHSGEPLVSFSQEEALELGLAVGDPITVNVLGRPVTARIANLRTVEWETLSINFVMVFSPNTFAGAPHGWLATLTMPGGAASDPARDGNILKTITRNFPAVTSVRVSDAIEAVNDLIGQLATAIRAASAVALAASLLVLAGALAAGNAKRMHDAVVLKTLGARRSSIMRSFVWEFALLGLATALFGLAAGGVAAWYVVTRIMTFSAVFDPVVALLIVAIALSVTIGVGLAATWRLLGQKAAPVLREL